MKRAFEVKQKGFFIIFKGPSIAKNYLRYESAPLIIQLILPYRLNYKSLNNNIFYQLTKQMIKLLR